MNNVVEIEIGIAIDQKGIADMFDPDPEETISGANQGEVNDLGVYATYGGCLFRRNITGSSPPAYAHPIIVNNFFDIPN